MKLQQPQTPTQTPFSHARSTQEDLLFSLAPIIVIVALPIIHILYQLECFVVELVGLIKEVGHDGLSLGDLAVDHELRLGTEKAVSQMSEKGTVILLRERSEREKGLNMPSRRRRARPPLQARLGTVAAPRTAQIHWLSAVAGCQGQFGDAHGFAWNWMHQREDEVASGTLTLLIREIMPSSFSLMGRRASATSNSGMSGAAQAGGGWGSKSWP